MCAPCILTSSKIKKCNIYWESITQSTVRFKVSAIMNISKFSNLQ